jgi:membrane peptidoglycan carboxypeptidase
MDRRTRNKRVAIRTLRRPTKRRPRVVSKLVIIWMFLAIVSAGVLGAVGTYTFAQAKLPHLKGDYFGNTEFVAANGKVLQDQRKKNKGNRIWARLELNPNNHHDCPQGTKTKLKQYWYTCTGYGIPAIVRDATIATEDPTFYSNPGFDPLAMLKAGVADLGCLCASRGGSGITQQLCKVYVLHNASDTLNRKEEELLCAVKITQEYTKDQLLDLYLNSVFYGAQAYGVQAASETYFHKSAFRLKIWQAAVLAGLPQAPSTYDPFLSPTPRGDWYGRMLEVLALMQERGYISLNQERVAQNQAQSFTFHQALTKERQQKFVDYVTNQFAAMTNTNDKSTEDPYLVARLGKHHGLHNGLKIVTTLNPTLQRLAQQEVHTQIVDALGQNVTDGALVTVDTRSTCYGCILAMVGSANLKQSLVHEYFPNENLCPECNMADSPRQPGSSFKVFNYVSAFSKGVAPQTEVLDEPLAIPLPDGSTYSPNDYDLTFHGPLSVALALGNSLNAPAVRVEVWNTIKRIADTAHRLGIVDLWKDNPSCCGDEYALTLGGMDRGVRLVQEVAAYGALATGGIKVPPLSFTKIIDRKTGAVLWRAKDDPWLKAQRVRVEPADNVFLLNSILSYDPNRCMEFGCNSLLELDRPSAAKTGTTNAFTDNWTVGYTPNQIVTGVWVGNADNSPMINSTGITGAAPIWHYYMEQAFNVLQLPVTEFTPPTDSEGNATVVEGSPACVVPGTISGETSYLPYGWYIAGTEPYCSVPTRPGIDDQPTYYPTPTPIPVPPVSTPTPTPGSPPGTYG